MQLTQLVVSYHFLSHFTKLCFRLSPCALFHCVEHESTAIRIIEALVRNGDVGSGDGDDRDTITSEEIEDVFLPFHLTDWEKNIILDPDLARNKVQESLKYNAVNAGWIASVNHRTMAAFQVSLLVIYSYEFHRVFLMARFIYRTVIVGSTLVLWVTRLYVGQTKAVSLAIRQARRGKIRPR